MLGEVQGPFQHVVAGVATAFRLQPTAAFVAPPPPVHYPLLSADRSSRASRRFPTPRRSLMSSWLVGGEDRKPKISVLIQTQTLRAPLESFENMRQGAENLEEEGQAGQEEQHDVTAGAASSAGLLCLERFIPVEVLRGLRYLANVTDPFKVEALRDGGGPDVNNDNEFWLDALTADINKFRTSSSTATGVELDLGQNQECFSSDQAGEAKQFLENSGKGRDRRTPEQTDLFASVPQRQLAVEAHEAVHWLKADIKRVASLFAREASTLSALAMSSFGDETLGGLGDRRDDVTVKLELFNKGKCPRFHLDKVPIRLICTYVGPSTEWLDSYDKRQMQSNRSPPPACNLKISGGREARRARPGDVLIFRGQPEGGPVEGGAFGVAHRSPDTVAGQRRLVLTMDVGDVKGLAAAAQTAS